MRKVSGLTGASVKVAHIPKIRTKNENKTEKKNMQILTAVEQLITQLF